MKEWQDGSEEIDWITNHALRTLIKQGDKHALSLIGYNQVEIKVVDYTIPKAVKLNDYLEFEYTIKSEANHPQKLLVDFIIHFMKKNGKTSPKVFKFTKLELSPQETVTINKKRMLKHYTTRTMYEGKHKIDLQINGTIVSSQEFDFSY